MVRWFVFFLLFFSSIVSYAQEELRLSVDKLEEFKFKNVDSLELYAQEIIRLSNPNQHLELGLGYHYLGNVQFTKYGNYDSALSLYGKALKHYQIQENSTQLSKLYNNYGATYKAKEDYEKAFIHYSNALDYDSEDTLSSIKLLNNIGEASFNLGNNEESEKYHLHAYEMAFHENDSLSLGHTLNRLGLVVSTNNEHKKAIQYYSNSLAYYSHSRVDSSFIIKNIGREFYILGNYEKAIPYFRKAIQVATSFNSRGNLAISYISLGQTILVLDKPDSENYMGKGIEIAIKLKMNSTLQSAHEFLAWYYEAHNQYELALDHYRKYKSYRESLLNENSLAKLNTLNVKFNTAQKEKQIANQELEIEQKNASIIKERNQKIVIAIGLIFMLLIGGLFYLRSQMQQRAKVQQAVIKEKELGLKAVFVATETERQRISKDLHDGVGQQLSGVKMQLESLTLKDKSLKEKKERIIENLMQASQEIRQISHQMMPRSLAEEGLVPTLEDMFEKTFSDTSINCSFEHHKADQRYPKDVELSLYRIVQELLTNIIKHANATSVSVQLYKIRNKLVMTVEDNGVGFDVELKGEGHGLLNIKSRIETVNGKVEYESSSTSETVITLSIPIA